MGVLLLSTSAVAALFAIYLILTHIHQSTKARRLSCLPAPLYLPWDPLGLHNLHLELTGMRTHRLSNSFLLRKTAMSRKTGRNCTTFRIKYPPGETWVYTFDPRNLQAVLVTQFADFQQAGARVGALRELLGEGIFSANGKKWEHSRALLRPQFMREQIADLELFERHVQDLLEVISSMPKLGECSETFDLQPFLERFTMDTATEFLFGESVNSLKDETTDSSTLVSKKEMLDFVQTFYAAEKTTAMSMILADLYWMMQNGKFKEHCKAVHRFVDTYIQRRLQSGEKPATGKYVVLDALVADEKDPKELRSQLLNILLAGSDTISGTLGFAVATLAQYSAIFAKLRKTIIDDFGMFDQPNGEITIARLKNCTYLQWFLNEVLRMYPAVPVNFKEAVRDTSLPVGGGPDGTSPVFIPKGHLVAWELWTMHSDPTLWGPDSHTFNPSRWAGRKLGFHYLSFNAGPRICIGQQFALAEVGYVIVRLLQRFDAIEGVGFLREEGRLPCDWKLVDKVAGGVTVRLRRSKN